MAGPRPFTLRQRRENAAFLAALRRTGNARLAARELGVHRATYTRRRAKSAAFAQAWDAALAFAHAALKSPLPSREHRVGHAPGMTWTARGAAHPMLVAERSEVGRGVCSQPLRTTGGEPHLVRAPSGRLQLRRAPPGRMTKPAEQAFLAALAATANVRLSAAAAGFAHSSFYARARASRAFAREMRLALATGYARVEAAALAAALPESHEDDAWRRNDLPPIPPMSPDQALQLLSLHEKSVHQSWEKPHRRRRRNESEEAYTERQRAMWMAEKRREAEDEAVRRAGDNAFTVPADHPPERPPLPALEQVTGWSKAKGAPKHNESRGMFGGWRLEDWERKKRKKG